jgi:RNA polymerase sigma factor (sigma-70 family)
MSELSQAESYLLEKIRKGDPEGWAELVQRYQGRLLAFARSQLPARCDPEDVVQETFIGFLKGINNYLGQASLETYLYTILRRKIIDTYRSKHTREVCLIQDIYPAAERDSDSGNIIQKMPASDPTASWYVRRDEQHHIQSQSLTQALRDLVNGYKKSLNFRDMQIVEMLFFSQLANKDVARITDLSEKNIAVIKHRCLKQVRQRIEREGMSEDFAAPLFENLLTEVWEAQRLSCPKRSTIGRFLLGTLDSDWQDYVDFHLNKLGCKFCRANLQDLQQQTETKEKSSFRQRIMESTVGFLHKT